MSSSVREVGQDEFQAAVVANQRPVLVDFWAPWCGPCKALAPALEDLAEMYQGEVDIVKVNVDSNTELANQFAVRNIPVLILFKDGKEVGRSIGGTKSRLSAFIEEHC